jgi:hypothetical protein
LILIEPVIGVTVDQGISRYPLTLQVKVPNGHNTIYRFQVSDKLFEFRGPRQEGLHQDAKLEALTLRAVSRKVNEMTKRQHTPNLAIRI